jgi:hypothetical protein
MKIKEIIETLHCKVICGNEHIENTDVTAGFSSDLMSDVLTLDFPPHEILLITGLCNLQALRTAEMADIKCILFVRDKSPTEEMIELGIENEMILLQYSGSMFKTSGLLYKAGLNYIY